MNNKIKAIPIGKKGVCDVVQFHAKNHIATEDPCQFCCCNADYSLGLTRTKELGLPPMFTAIKKIQVGDCRWKFHSEIAQNIINKVINNANNS